MARCWVSRGEPQRRLVPDDVGCLETRFSLADLESDFFPLGEGSQSIASNSRVVDLDFGTTFGSDGPQAFRVVEPLHGSQGHAVKLSIKRLGSLIRTEDAPCPEEPSRKAAGIRGQYLAPVRRRPV